MEPEDGPRAAGASGRDLRGRCPIAGLLRTAAGGRVNVNLFRHPSRAREAATEPQLLPADRAAYERLIAMVRDQGKKKS
jgi:hypothetical protein